MKYTEEITYEDRKEFGDGPWNKELDKAVWKDEATNLDCMIVRNPFGGHLCGYVGIPLNLAEHFGEEEDFDVHGGITYRAACDGELVCHKSDQEVFWLGFDCAHYQDYSPGFSFLQETENYKNFEFVQKEIKSLAVQIKNRIGE